MAGPILTPGDVHPQGRAAGRMYAWKPGRRTSVAHGRLSGAPRMLPCAVPDPERLP
jgi:hypothetical protein